MGVVFDFFCKKIKNPLFSFTQKHQNSTFLSRYQTYHLSLNMQLVLDTEGVTLKRHDGCFLVIAGEESRMISPLKITSIAFTSQSLVSSAAIRLAAEHQIPMVFVSAAGNPEARLDSLYFSNLPMIRRQQVLFAYHPEATAWIINLFKIKQLHQADNCHYLAHRTPSLATKVAKTLQNTEGVLLEMSKHQNTPIADIQATLMGLEGTIARYYWQIVAEAIGDPQLFNKRSRRPAADAFNALLNYGYGMLYNVVENGVLAAGLDPQLGFLHTDDYARPTLVFDMIEPFRPWVDRLVLEQFLTKQANEVFFETKEGGIFLNKAGKKWWIPLFNAAMLEKCRFQEKQLSRRNHINRFAGEFAQSLKIFKSQLRLP
jgi:CRISP-associated protein Cas1